MHLLNFVLSMIKQDRENALTQYDNLSDNLSGAGFDDMNGISASLLLKDTAEALTSFLKNSSQSTDQAIKVAQILANHLIKMDKNSTLTDADREEIESTVKGLVSETKEIDNILKVGFK